MKAEPDIEILEKRDRRLRLRYSILTIAIFLPLLWSFLALRSLYPVTSWTVMMSGGSLENGWTYYVVRGETVSGEIVDIRPPKLTDALYARTWSMVRATINNDAFRLASPHPHNASLLMASGGFEKLPRGARLPELLTTWGLLYNQKLPVSSPMRLKAVRVDVYRWDSGDFQNYDRFLETWRQEL